MARKGPAPIADDADKTFMHEQRATDEADSRHGEASKKVKECAQFIAEAAARIAAARKITSTPDAIAHDLERITQLSGRIQETASEALELYNR